ncbi:MAG: hypothetical protein IKX36_08990 [Prevotella sp.]|nr:hypothetical protein [Prevotella sp.]
MAIQGKLKIGGRTYSVVECSYEFSQAIDDTGKPTSRPKGGTITFTMPSSSDDDLFFYRWMFSKTEIQAGKFQFVVFSNENKRSYKTVDFINAYCVGLRDYFNDNDSRLMYTTVTISAQIIRMGSLDSAIFNNEWSTDS